VLRLRGISVVLQLRFPLCDGIGAQLWIDAGKQRIHRSHKKLNAVAAVAILPESVRQFAGDCRPDEMGN
jgi:hypothetical protein